MSILADIEAVRTQLNADIVANGTGDITGNLLNTNLVDLLDTLEAKLVTSFEGRTGEVTVSASDYDASQVDNDSGVTGTFVDDALDTLNTTAKTECLIIAASDETSDIDTGLAKTTFRMPYAMTITEVRASLTTAPTDSTFIVDINDGGTSIMTTNKLNLLTTATIDDGTATVTDAALADKAEITIDVDQIGSTIAGAGLKIYIIGTRV